MSGRARLGAVALLLTTVVVAGQVTAGSAPPAAAPQPVAVTSGTAVCPDVRQEEGRAGTAVTAVRVTGAPALAGGPLAGPSSPLPPAPVVRDVAAGSPGAYAVTADGEGAGAVVVEQATRTTAGSRRGLSAVACPAPSPSSWFVGGGTGVGSTSELLLANVEEVAALVDVRVWTGEGPADPRPGRGLVVPPRGRLVVPLDRLAPDRDLLALHVQATRGRVAAAVRVARADGRTPLGTDWVPAGRAPAVEQVVPGLPAGPGRRTALLTNPTSDDALARVEIIGTDGSFVPERLQAVDLPAGTSVAVDLSAELADAGAALRVRSDGAPLLAGALVVDAGSGPVREVAFSSSVPALDAPAALADVRLSPATEATLLLSAPEDDAVVELRPRAAPGGLPAPQRVEVPAGTTVAVNLSRLLPGAPAGSLSLEVRPLAGRVHAARYSRESGPRGPLTTLLPLVAGRRTALPPAVVADPAAGRS